MIIFALGCFAVAAVALLKLIGLGFQAVGLILKALLQILAWIGAPLDPNTRMVRGMSGRLKPPAPLKPTPTFAKVGRRGATLANA